jgi:hypothetical protein
MLCAACASQHRLPPGAFTVTAVERRVDQEELRQAVEQELARATICIPIPNAHWGWQEELLVQFGPTEFRGRPIGSDVEQKLDDFVDMGLWVKVARPDFGERTYQYQLTQNGEMHYQGHRYRPYEFGSAFCLPAERRLLEIVRTEDTRGGGSTRVHFTHTADNWPWWLPTDELRRRFGALLPPVGAVSNGSLSLSRIREYGNRHGRLASFCWDAVHGRRFLCEIDLS